jgi:hypothetical protein
MLKHMPEASTTTQQCHRHSTHSHPRAPQSHPTTHTRPDPQPTPPPCPTHPTPQPPKPPHHTPAQLRVHLVLVHHVVMPHAVQRALGGVGHTGAGRRQQAHQQLDAPQEAHRVLDDAVAGGQQGQRGGRGGLWGDGSMLVSMMSEVT